MPRNPTYRLPVDRESPQHLSSRTCNCGKLRQSRDTKSVFVLIDQSFPAFQFPDLSLFLNPISNPTAHFCHNLVAIHQLAQRIVRPVFVGVLMATSTARRCSREIAARFHLLLSSSRIRASARQIAQTCGSCTKSTDGCDS